MSENRYRVSRRARLDMREIWEYIAQDNPAAADRLLARIHHKFEMLGRQPLIGSLAEDLLPDLRFAVVRKKYVIYYFPRNDGVEIVRVLHGARDATQLFDPTWRE